jgi:DNA modification methylase
VPGGVARAGAEGAARGGSAGEGHLRTFQIIHGHALEELRRLAADSIHCCITSPPYWGLRDYKLEPVVWGEWRGSLGLEPTPELYVEHMVTVFREVRRVLRADGVCFLNMGDGYASSSTYNTTNTLHTRAGWKQDDVKRPNPRTPPGLKPKDLCMIPARVALALQSDGWWLRSEIVWAKPNPMPESVTDRPTKAHEMVYLLTKSPKYFWDAEAVREPASPDTHARYARGRSRNHKWADGGPGNQTIAKTFEHMRKPGVCPKDVEPGRGIKTNTSFHAATADVIGSRNLRTVWTIPTAPFPEAHFATFPPALVEPMVQVGTSERGCCGECGVPWEREVATSYENPGNRSTNGPRSIERKHEEFGTAGFNKRLERRSTTTGWRPSCDCGAEPVPATILDPFAGAGTTGLVALRLNRQFVGIELNREYCEMARRRIVGDAPLLNEEVAV